MKINNASFQFEFEKEGEMKKGNEKVGFRYE